LQVQIGLPASAQGNQRSVITGLDPVIHLLR
jgi:hypothetical protein